MPFGHPQNVEISPFCFGGNSNGIGPIDFFFMEQETVPVLTHIHARIRDTSQSAAGGKMSTFADLVQLARICLRQARISRTPEVAHAFRQMAEEYQKKAANLIDGEAPDMDERLLDDAQRAAARR
jgi:hypothetical protein